MLAGHARALADAPSMASLAFRAVVRSRSRIGEGGRKGNPLCRWVEVEPKREPCMHSFLANSCPNSRLTMLSHNGGRIRNRSRGILLSSKYSSGSSGGRLFDTEGRLIGITTFFLKEGQNLNFALRGDWVQALASH